MHHTSSTRRLIVHSCWVGGPCTAFGVGAVAVHGRSRTFTLQPSSDTATVKFYRFDEGHALPITDAVIEEKLT